MLTGDGQRTHGSVMAGFRHLLCGDTLAPRVTPEGKLTASKAAALGSHWPGTGHWASSASRVCSSCQEEDDVP